MARFKNDFAIFFYVKNSHKNLRNPQNLREII
jgi:hypothetical protein